MHSLPNVTHSQAVGGDCPRRLLAGPHVMSDNSWGLLNMYTSHACMAVAKVAYYNVYQQVQQQLGKW
jgi:hypothetical protein